MKYTRILCSLHSLHDGQLVEDSLHYFISLTNKKNTHTHTFGQRSVHRHSWFVFLNMMLHWGQHLT